MKPSLHILFLIVAIVLFLVAGLTVIAVISGPVPLALIAFGLASLAIAMLPI